MKLYFGLPFIALLSACTAPPDRSDLSDVAAVASSLQDGNAAVAEKDLAIIFDKSTNDLVTSKENFNGDELLSEAWYAATEKAFSIGDPYQSPNASKVLERENTRSEWENVTTRIAPCEPLGVAPFQKATVLCTPEVRLVMQPVKPLFRGAKYFASDRGIHLLYDVSDDIALTGDEQSDFKALKAKVREAVAAGTWRPGTSGPLTSDEEQRFVRARDKVARALMADVLALRDVGLPKESFRSLGPRPELATSDTRAAFMARYSRFLAKYARAGSLKQLAAMSASRPFPFWKGTFVSLRPGIGGLIAESLGITSPVSGRELLPLGKQKQTSDVAITDGTFNSAATNLSDEQLQIANGIGRESPLDDALRAELRQISLAPIGSIPPGTLNPRPLLSPRGDSQQYATLKNRISDRSQLLVRNSSCGSCHSLKQDRAFAPGGALEEASDLHNLSYYSVAGVGGVTERGLSPSPRVVKDVAFDLAWLESELALR